MLSTLDEIKGQVSAYPVFSYLDSLVTVNFKEYYFIATKDSRFRGGPTYRNDFRKWVSCVL